MDLNNWICRQLCVCIRWNTRSTNANDIFKVGKIGFATTCPKWNEISLSDVNKTDNIILLSWIIESEA